MALDWKTEENLTPRFEPDTLRIKYACAYVTGAWYMVSNFVSHLDYLLSGGFSRQFVPISSQYCPLVHLSF